MAISWRILDQTVQQAGYRPTVDWQAGVGEIVKVSRFSYVCGHRDELLMYPGWFDSAHAVKEMLATELGRECPNCRYADFIASWKSGQ